MKRRPDLLCGWRSYLLTLRKISRSIAIGVAIFSFVDAFGQSQNQNYISKVTFLKENQDPTQFQNLPDKNYLQSTTYYDGLGRAIQNVVKQGSPAARDIVQPIVYDAFGREARKYLPFTLGSDGSYKASAQIINPANGDYINDAAAFYNNAASKVAVDAKPFAETRFEPNPLNRVLEQGAPGTGWQPDGTNSYNSVDRTVKKAYGYNRINEVRQWTYGNPASAYLFGQVSAGTSSAPVYYDPSTLYVNRTKDEQHHEVIEYVDKVGHVVLKRVQVAEGNPAVNDTNYASTYYIYDNFENLVCVIQPEGAANIAEYLNAEATNNQVAKEVFLKKWAFRYSYDHRKRMIMKQVPGAEPVYMVYDNRDRLVLSQDGERRAASEWIFTKYDRLNRPVLTGITAIAGTPGVVQGNLNSFYETLPNGAARFETYSIAGSHYGYDNKSYPQISSLDDYHTVTYYDKYDATIVPPGYGPESQQLPGEETGSQDPVLGQVTGTLVRNLETNAWMRTVNYYDEKYR